jgi:hypothetical protein
VFESLSQQHFTTSASKSTSTIHTTVPSHLARFIPAENHSTDLFAYCRPSSTTSFALTPRVVVAVLAALPPTMPARKRGRGEMEIDEAVSEPPSLPGLLVQIRGMWEFASLMQFLFFFGKAVKLDDVDVEVGLSFLFGSLNVSRVLEQHRRTQVYSSDVELKA